MARKPKKAASAEAWQNQFVEIELRQVESGLASAKERLESLPDDTVGGPGCDLGLARSVAGLGFGLGKAIGRIRARGDVNPQARGAFPEDLGAYEERLDNANKEIAALSNTFVRKCVLRK